MLNLSVREKNALVLAGIFMALFVVVQFIYYPAMDKQQRLRTALEYQQHSLGEMIRLQQQYQALNRGVLDQKQMIQERPPDFSLFSFLDAQAEQSGVKKRVDYMQPFEQESPYPEYDLERVKVKLKALVLKELMTFLFKVEEDSSGVFITSLSISRTGKQQDVLDAVVEAQTLIPRQISRGSM
ncbi:MAG: general secretion pathway protein GspM [Desulfobacteraceae bacterium]|nr:MAG: general secretion pathway protein GspM [Desulfobacteraceae bacterium]